MQIFPVMDAMAVHYSTYAGNLYTLSSDSITLTAGTLTAEQITSTNNMQASGKIQLVLDGSASDNYLGIGDSDAFKVYHDGSHTYVKNSTGSVILNGAAGSTSYWFNYERANTDFWISGDTREGLFQVDANQDSIYMGNSTGGTYVKIDLNGILSFIGSAYLGGITPLRLDGSSSTNYISVGLSDDLKLYHEGGNSYLDNSTGNLILTSSTQLGNSATADTVGINVAPDANSLITSSFTESAVNSSNYYFRKTFTHSGGVSSGGQTVYGDNYDINLSGEIRGTNSQTAYGSYIDITSTSNMDDEDQDNSSQTITGYYSLINANQVAGGDGPEGEPTIIARGGYFRATSDGSGSAQGGVRYLYGLASSSTGDLGTTSLSSHYGHEITVSGTADVNYGLYINTVMSGSANYGIYDNSGADWILAADDHKILFGAGQDFELFFDGTYGRLDATGDPIRIGDDTTNCIQISNTGTVSFLGSAGLIIPSGTTPAPATEGSLFLDTDASANGDLVIYSNGAWRTIATL